MMNHIEVMTQAVHTLRSRGDQYGPVEASFDRISKIASLILNMEVTPREVAAILHAVKLSRMSNDPSNPDHYIDGINYMSFMAQFSTPQNVPATNVEREVATLARQSLETSQEYTETGGNS